jgi:thiosulfate/3-mercaptopyruvate sulfurtransferase
MSTQELADNLSNVKLIDASYYLPAMKRDRHQEYQDKRITNQTVFFDCDAIADTSSEFGHMLPSEEVFVENMKKLDI